MAKRFACIALLVIASLGGRAFAQGSAEPELTPEQQQVVAKMKALWESLDRRTGKISLGSGLATLDVPNDFYFLDAKDTERVLVEVWRNPPGGSHLGMLFPAEHTPFDKDAWAVTIEYDEDGHVSDSDAAGINYSDLLKEMQSGVREANAGRVSAGYPRIELVGWAEPPHYDSGARKLYWAKELRFGDEPDTTLNYEIRALGRSGVLSMTFIAATDQLAAINERRDAVLSMATFNQGKRYEDFDANIDKVAAYGIGALIAGKVAAKAGLLAGGLLLLKKFGVVIAVAFAAGARRLKGLFSRPA